jgi:hypothetical protein
MMLSKQIKPSLLPNHGNRNVRAFSVMSSYSYGSGSIQRNANKNHHQLQQNRTILGLIPAIDKRLYRLAKGVMPPISKTEQIALGCGTIGKETVGLNCVKWLKS